MSQVSLALWGSIIGITTMAGLLALAILPGTVTGGVLGKEVTQYTESLNYLERADADYKAGRYQIADAEYGEALRRNPQLVLAYLGRGLTRFPQGNYRGDPLGGIDDFTMVLSANPQNSTAYEKRGCLRFYKADYGGALSDFTSAIMIDPRNAEAYFGRAFTRRFL